VVVREHADRRSLVDGCRREEAVRPLDDELVHVREALGRHEPCARVADRGAVAEEPAEPRERGSVVDRAEDVHRGPRGEGEDECLDAADGGQRRLAAREQRSDLRLELAPGRPVRRDEPLRAGVGAGDRDGERDRSLRGDRFGERRDEVGSERVNEDVDGPAAGQADLERVLVGDPVRPQAWTASGEYLQGLLVDGGLDATAGDGPGDLPALRDGENGTGIARRRPLGPDDSRGRDANPFRDPALQRREHVLHAVRLACGCLRGTLVGARILRPRRPCAGCSPTIGSVPLASVEDVERALRKERYLPDRGLATAIFLALEMRRPLLLEGEAGVGKTEVGKTLARILGAELIRLQCYEGIDAAQALYEWDYSRQLLYARALQAGEIEPSQRIAELYGPEFLLERPLLRAIRAGAGAVLLIDELDRADDEFEAFLLEVLSDFAVTVPELGTLAAAEPPAVVVTSNRTRELHDALKRRCLYHWIDFPELEREVAIIRLRAPAVSAALARSVAEAVDRLRRLDLVKPPGAAEAIDWAQALALLGAESANGGAGRETLGWAIKNREDLRRAESELLGA
jgi:MoxR-like ATPase